MAGSEMITIDELIVAIRMPSVVLDRATHLYGVCRLPMAVVAVVMRVLEAVRLVRSYELSSHRRYSDNHRVTQPSGLPPIAPLSPSPALCFADGAATAAGLG